MVDQSLSSFTLHCVTNCGVWWERYALSSLIVLRYYLLTPSMFLMTVKTSVTHVTETEHGTNHSWNDFVTDPPTSQQYCPDPLTITANTFVWLIWDQCTWQSTLILRLWALWCILDWRLLPYKFSILYLCCFVWVTCIFWTYSTLNNFCAFLFCCGLCFSYFMN